MFRTALIAVPLLLAGLGCATAPRAPAAPVVPAVSEVQATGAPGQKT